MQKVTVVDVRDGIVLIVERTRYVDNWCGETRQSVWFSHHGFSHPLDKDTLVTTTQQVRA